MPMTLRNILPFTLTASLLVAAGSTTMLHADDPGNTGCTQTPEACWQEVFCDRVSACLESAGNSSSAFLACLMDDAVTGHQVCSDNICPNTYFVAQERPTNKQCNDMYDARQKYCKFSGPNRTICGRTSTFGSSSGFRDALRAACAKAARQEWLACLSNASPNLDPSEFNSGIHQCAAMESEMINPAQGIHAGQIVLVPMSECSSSVDRAIVRAMLWIESDWEWVTLGEFDRGADMCTEVSVDTKLLSSLHYISDLSITINWMDGERMVWGTAYDLTIAESRIPGDFNRDGERNADDLVAFLDAYDNNAPRADLNYDGVVDAADLELFLMQFDAN